MRDSDLTVDYEFLADCERKLGQLKKTFEDIENRRDDMKEHWGSGDIAGAMEDFVDNWDDYRTRLVESLESVGKLVAGTKKAFEDLDKQLAKAATRRSRRDAVTPTSKRRPVDWQPLCDSDPVPGDPGGDPRRGQAHGLGGQEAPGPGQEPQGDQRRGDPQGQVRQSLREESCTLEKHMREVAGRYERVHGHLTKWSNELEDFQSDADKVLHQAKEKQGEIEAEKKKEADSGDKDTPPASASGTDHDPLQSYRNRLNTSPEPGHPRQPPCGEDPRRDRRRDRGLVVGRRQGLGP